MSRYLTANTDAGQLRPLVFEVVDWDANLAIQTASAHQAEREYRRLVHESSHVELFLGNLRVKQWRAPRVGAGSPPPGVDSGGNLSSLGGRDRSSIAVPALPSGGGR